MTLQVLIVEDHPQLQAALREFIGRMPNFDVWAAVATAEEALEALAGYRPDLVLIDMGLPEMDGAALVVTIRNWWPGLPCVILSGHGEEPYIARALEAGAQGYIVKGRPGELEPALERIAAGEVYVSERL